MNIKLVKILYAILCILAGLTVGLVLALYVGIMSFLHTFVVFPVQVYKGCVKSAIDKKNGEDSDDVGGMWERHIRKMKDLNEKN
jgi:hypothetical protein